MQTFYAEIILHLPKENYWPAYVKFEARDFGEAARTIDVWGRCVESLSDMTVTCDSLSAGKKRGQDALPLLDRNLLRNLFLKARGATNG